MRLKSRYTLVPMLLHELPELVKDNEITVKIYFQRHFFMSRYICKAAKVWIQSRSLRLVTHQGQRAIQLTGRRDANILFLHHYCAHGVIVIIENGPDNLSILGPVDWGCRINQMHLCIGVRLPQ